MPKTTDLTKEINKILKTYSDDVQSGLNEAVPQIAKDAVKELKTAGSFKDHTGDYRKGWTYTLENTRLGVNATIHNKHYQLTHLLEFGHVKQNGGRTRAFPHIADVEEDVIEKFTRKVEELAQ